MHNENRHSAAANYGSLLQRHERMLRWMCLRRAFGDPDLADDYYQEVALTLWRHLPDFDNDLSWRKERAYVKQAARCVLSHCSRKRHPDLQRLEAEMVIALDQRDKDDEQLLNTFVNELPEGERTVVGLYRSGYSFEEIGVFLHLSSEAVRQRLHRATLKMQKMYEKECDTIKNKQYEQ